ncbi:class II D-tagatose-bisphosphate aldolase, non-catalytic subunit [Tropicimonas sp. IMCC6043]|uniref:class II D-tagatose-bisphosphate aldolase, non-catalytic subunit n=1 Tax=Tropicimonas sp. IMCC6043 TaxID=2510645 RepID=UPI00101B628F|nr:class II D-tagatose-bisphosphate aldolase, non-catalytic subunit [Tropicimonas sp. IMCC6043]RYH12272.1 tagatose-bisphosphate aldolase [Tropicimonas sp. IMCC6043]
MTSLALFRDILQRNRAGKGGGVTSVCSAHPLVLRALFRSARARDTVALVESTSNQVDQFGGYTGMRPVDFVKLVHEMADAEGFPRERILLGGDHLGPNTWRGEGAEAAMEKTRDLVRAYVTAGYRKIHLDASFVCSGDPTPLTNEIVAERAAEMAKVAESCWDDTPPLYVIGTEVPTPGGALDAEEMHVTRPADVQKTLAAFRDAFSRHGLDAAWERVVGLVVQPGVEFGDAMVEDYAGAPELSGAILDYPGMVYEAHSTDYQSPENLSRLVEDHFCILKVGPWLTWALREGLIALELIETELSPDEPSRFREVLTTAMKDGPRYWAQYYTGEQSQIDFKLIYSYSDRARYYLPRPDVTAAIDRLMRNLSAGIPEGLVSQHLPMQYRALRSGKLDPTPVNLLISRVCDVVDVYLDA